MTSNVRSEEEMRERFRPEFLNRIDEIVAFQKKEALTREQLGSGVARAHRGRGVGAGRRNASGWPSGSARALEGARGTPRSPRGALVSAEAGRVLNGQLGAVALKNIQAERRPTAPGRVPAGTLALSEGKIECGGQWWVAESEQRDRIALSTAKPAYTAQAQEILDCAAANMQARKKGTSVAANGCAA